jgi:alanine dehydrogenase
MRALIEDEGFAKGVNVFRGHLTCEPVADTLGLMASFSPFLDLVQD